MDPVEVPMMVGLFVMALGIALGNLATALFGSVIIIAGALYNLLTAQNGPADQ